MVPGNCKGSKLRLTFHGQCCGFRKRPPAGRRDGFTSHHGAVSSGGLPSPAPDSVGHTSRTVSGDRHECVSMQITNSNRAATTVITGVSRDVCHHAGGRRGVHECVESQERGLVPKAQGSSIRANNHLLPWSRRLEYKLNSLNSRSAGEGAVGVAAVAPACDASVRGALSSRVICSTSLSGLRLVFVCTIL